MKQGDMVVVLHNDNINNIHYILPAGDYIIGPLLTPPIIQTRFIGTQLSFVYTLNYRSTTCI